MKKAESIAIDEQFKADLRGELILRAGLNETGQRNARGEKMPRQTDLTGVSGEATGGFMDGAADFFRKWKYQLALVPVALMLVLVAVQSFKMPVKIDSQVVVPTSEQTQGAETLAAKTTEGTEGPGSSVEGATSYIEGEVPQGNGQGVSSLPMPTIVQTNANTGNGGGANVASGGTENGAGENAANTTNENTATQPVTSGTAEPAQVSRTVQSIQQQTLQYVPQPASSTESAPAVNPVSTKKPGIAAGDVPPELLQQSQVQGSGQTSVTMQTSVTTVQPQTETRSQTEQTQEIVQSQTVQSPQIVTRPALTQPGVDTDSGQNVQSGTAVNSSTGAAPVIVPVTTLAPSSVTAPAIETPRAVETAPAIEAAPDLMDEVSYDFSFSGDKTDFEDKVLKGLLVDDGYSFASVTEGDDGVVTVELSADNGMSATKMFKFNNRTHVWNQVVYVQKYYYDDNLQYDRVNLTPSSDYLPGSTYIPAGERVYNPYDYRYGY